MAKVKQDRYTMMLEAPIPPLICRLAVPTIISMLVTSIYNMADTYFVGRISTSASAPASIAAWFILTMSSPFF